MSRPVLDGRAGRPLPRGMRRLRRARSPRGREHHLPGPLRAPAPRPGERGIVSVDGQRALRPPRHGAGGGRLRREDARASCRVARHRPRALLDRRRQPAAQRPALLRHHRRRARGDRPQRQPRQRGRDPARARGARRDLQHHGGQRGDRPAAGALARAEPRGAADRRALAREGRLQPRHADARRADRRARSARLPAPQPRAPRRRLGRRQRDLRPRPDRRLLRARPRPRRGGGDPARAPAHAAALHAGAPGELLHLRVHLLRAARLEPERPQRLRLSARSSAACWPASIRCPPTWWCRCSTRATRRRSATRRSRASPTSRR